MRACSRRVTPVRAWRRGIERCENAAELIEHSKSLRNLLFELRQVPLRQQSEMTSRTYVTGLRTHSGNIGTSCFGDPTLTLERHPEVLVSVVPAGIAADRGTAVRLGGRVASGLEIGRAHV